MKKLFSIATITSSYLFLASQVFAQTVSACPQGGQFGTLCFGASDFGQVIGTVITFLFVLSGIFALIFMVWGGLKWVMSQGDKGAVEGARNQIVAALIGLIFVFLSYVFVNLFLNFFANTSLSHLQLPTLR